MRFYEFQFVSLAFFNTLIQSFQFRKCHYLDYGLFRDVKGHVLHILTEGYKPANDEILEPHHTWLQTTQVHATPSGQHHPQIAAQQHPGPYSILR